MEVIHYGNACFSLFHHGVHVLCDPWLEGPAVAGGWEKFPPSQTRVKDLPKIDYIFISHIHSDHCEYHTLEKLDKSIPIIILDRKPLFLGKMLRGVGFENLILVPEGGKTLIAPGLHVETFGSAVDHISSNIIDSSILFDFGDYIALNCNDNTPVESFCQDVADRYKQIDLAFLPSAGGSGYPAMYKNLSDEEKREKAKAAIENSAKIFTNAVDILHPKIVVPVAGGFVIRGPHAETVNWFQCRRLNLLEMVEYYNQNGKFDDVKIIPLQPEIEMDADIGKVTKGEYHVWSKNELNDHFAKIAKEPIYKIVHTTKPMKSLPNLFKKVRKNLWLKQEFHKMFPEYTIYFDLPDWPTLFELPLYQEEVSEISRESDLKTPYLKMSLDQDTLLEWFLGFEDFNMLDSGHRVGFYRFPELYVVEAYFLMSLLRM